MNINDLTIRQAKDIAESIRSLATENKATVNHSLMIGECYLIRTVTMMYTGKILRITESDIVLGDAAWIADSGRYSNALNDGTLSEVEPYPDSVVVSRAAMVDAAIWTHPLPREQK